MAVWQGKLAFSQCNPFWATDEIWTNQKHRMPTPTSVCFLLESLHFFFEFIKNKNLSQFWRTSKSLTNMLHVSLISEIAKNGLVQIL